MFNKAKSTGTQPANLPHAEIRMAQRGAMAQQLRIPIYIGGQRARAVSSRKILSVSRQPVSSTLSPFVRGQLGKNKK